MQGRGLLTGLYITLTRFFAKKVTVQYPEEKIALGPLFRGGELQLSHQKCIACGLCASACPNQVIELTTRTNEQKKRQLTSYIYHSGRCLYCDYCIEACPTAAICWNQQYERSSYFRNQLEIDCLALSLQRPPAAAADAAAAGRADTGKEEGSK
ncbi:4Fe-4S dicluster domain-containing protein|uniref:NADH-quinone oxidoreductase subunit I n=1 Tax=Dendrosporobacter quercicolus TaxID=146817 RepID=A0A1G9QCD1_9FIRM|nr:4Fe-4S dicluster domain-containing protein [Dendrosporobacter quercicolus]NSL48195.1 4Fe-4S dicluster domain-containing protein [Dendrosporobacter quercicolus DSM 1736]SDM08724.1 NADH-quinone oxidoreductase subunit I [Dendrosporobacter quercicolus]